MPPWESQARYPPRTLVLLSLLLLPVTMSLRAQLDARPGRTSPPFYNCGSLDGGQADGLSRVEVRVPSVPSTWPTSWRHRADQGSLDAAGAKQEPVTSPGSGGSLGKRASPTADDKGPATPMLRPREGPLNPGDRRDGGVPLLSNQKPAPPSHCPQWYPQVVPYARKPQQPHPYITSLLKLPKGFGGPGCLKSGGSVMELVLCGTCLLDRPPLL